MIGQVVLAPLNSADQVEGIVTSYNEDNGKVTVFTANQEVFIGYEYQLEFVE